MKKKVLLSSILTIALCATLIVGSTFALFTDKEAYDISVTAGKVDISAEAAIDKLWSAAPSTTADDKYLEIVGDPTDFDLFEGISRTYTHVAQTGTFANDGEATYANGVLTVERFTPGDRVDLRVKMTNESDVTMSYRFVVELVSDGGLASGMVLGFGEDNDVGYEGFKKYTSKWTVIEAPDGDAVIDEVERVFTFELPIYAGNSYETKSVSYKITVEAVQGNATVDNADDVGYVGI